MRAEPTTAPLGLVTAEVIFEAAEELRRVLLSALKFLLSVALSA